MFPQLNTEDNLTSEPVPDPATSEPGNMSMTAPLAISQPVREWVASTRENIRPLGTFCNTANFQVGWLSSSSLVNYHSKVPPSLGRFTKRFFKNIDYFQSNYVLVFLVLVLYCLISSPMLLIVIAVSGIAAHTAARRNKDRKLSVAGNQS